MRVGRVEAFAVRYPEPNNDGKIRALTLVRVETDDGLVGWGEAITGGQETSLAVAFVVERRLAPDGPGQRPAGRGGRLELDLRDATFWDGNGGLVTFGISALDMALWDIAGKAAGVPLYRPPRRQAARPPPGVRLRPSSPRTTSTAIGLEFRGFVADGYRYVKGGWGHDLSDRLRQRRAARPGDRPRRARRRSGPDVHMIVDVAALMGWDASHAIRMCRAIDDDVRLLLVRGSAGRAGSRRLPAPPRRRGHSHLHRGKGLARGALPGPHRIPGDRRHHDRPRPGGGRDRRPGGSSRWRPRPARAWNAHSWSSALNTAAALHLAVAASNTLLFELKPVPSPDAARARDAPHRARRTAGSRRPRGRGSGVERGRGSRAALPVPRGRPGPLSAAGRDGVPGVEWRRRRPASTSPRHRTSRPRHRAASGEGA